MSPWPWVDSTLRLLSVRRMPHSLVSWPVIHLPCTWFIILPSPVSGTYPVITWVMNFYHIERYDIVSKMKYYNSHIWKNVIKLLQLVAQQYRNSRDQWSRWIAWCYQIMKAGNLWYYKAIGPLSIWPALSVYRCMDVLICRGIAIKLQLASIHLCKNSLSSFSVYVIPVTRVL